MHVSSYWAKTSNPQPKRPKLEGDFHTDIAIIGAGFTGLSTAYYLQKLGYKTVILDENCVGWGASGRNGSLMLIGYKHSLHQLAKKFGIEAAQEMLQMSLDGISLVKRIVEEHHISCELTNKGSFNAAYKPSHLESLKREQQFMMESLNYENLIVEKTDVGQELDSPLYHGGLIDPNSYYLHPLNFAIGLAEAAESLGATIYEQSKVVSIDRKQGDVILSTSSGRVIAKELVVATNGYTSSITKNLAKSVIPVGSYIVTTENLDPSLANSLIPNKRGTFDTKNFLYYFRLTSDHRLLFGGRVHFKGKESEELYQTLQQSMVDVFPQLTDYRIEYKWGGMLALTFDLLPHIGITEEGTHFALGYSGHGVSLSTLMGKLISLNIDQNNRQKSELEKLPLRRIPFHGQRAIVLSIVGSYFQFMDWVS